MRRRRRRPPRPVAGLRRPGGRAPCSVGILERAAAGGWAGAAGNRADDGPVAVLVEWIVAHPRIAQVQAGGWENRPKRGSRSRRILAFAASADWSGPARNTSPGVIGKLPRRNRKRPDRDAGQGDVDQFPDVLHRADLDLGGERAPQGFRRHVALHRQHETRGAQDRPVADRADPHAVAGFAQRDRDRRLLQHGGQRPPQIGDDRGEAALQIVMAIGRIGGGRRVSRKVANSPAICTSVV